MPLLVKIALRNLLERRARSLAAGAIIGVGALVLVAGGAVIDASSRGIRQAFTASFTGDVFIAEKAGAPVSLLGLASEGGPEPAPYLSGYRRIVAYARSRPETRAVAAQVTTYAGVNVYGNENREDALATVLFGIEPESYRRAFDNLTLVSGRYLRPREEGILLSRGEEEALRGELGVELRPGDRVSLAGLGRCAFCARDVTVRGIFAFRGLDPLEAASGGGLHIAYVDAATARALRWTVGPPSARDPWSFILVRLKNPADARRYIAGLNGWLATERIDARAGDWKEAAGGFGLIADAMRIVFAAGILAVAAVALIVVMSALAMSVVERTAEIGTMRAIGAQRGFIRRMIMVETLAVSLVSGGIGAALGAALVGVLDLARIGVTGSLPRMLLAGPVFRPVVSASSVAWALAAVVVAALFAQIYPVSVALKVEPVRAIQAE